MLYMWVASMRHGNTHKLKSKVQPNLKTSTQNSKPTIWTPKHPDLMLHMSTVEHVLLFACIAHKQQEAPIIKDISAVHARQVRLKRLRYGASVELGPLGPCSVVTVQTECMFWTRRHCLPWVHCHTFHFLTITCNVSGCSSFFSYVCSFLLLRRNTPAVKAILLFTILRNTHLHAAGVTKTRGSS